MLGWKPSVTSAAPSMALPSRTFAAVAPRQGCGAADSCLTVTCGVVFTFGADLVEQALFGGPPTP